MIIEKKLHKLSLCVLAACGFAVAPQLMAQEAESDSTAEKQTAERIQVVGSRIRTDSFANDTPIDILSIEDAETEGLTTLGQLLRTSTAASGSSQITSAFTVGFVTDGGTGAETVSLRGLGANRTLVLINGRRTGPAGTRGAVSSVDLNSIPVSMIERVEILKDGASALYGSDAVAGVINVITKKGDDKSITVDINKPVESGGTDKRFNISYGDVYADGSFRITADYRKIDMITRGQRDFLECSEDLVFDANGNRADVIDPRTGTPRCNESAYGLWFYGPGLNQAFGGSVYGFYDYDGFLSQNGYDDFGSHPLNTIGFEAPDGWFPVNWRGDKESRGLWNVRHPFLDKATLQPEQTIGSLYATGEYSLTDDITVYGEFIHSQRNTKVNGYRQVWTSGTVASNVPGWSGDTTGLDPVALTDHSGVEVDVDYTRAVVGATGDVGFWTWDLSLQQSHSKGTYANKVIYADSRALSFQNWAGGASCAGQNTPISNVPCVDINWTDPDFLYGNHTQEQRDFLFGVDVGETTYKMQTLEGYVTGDLFTLPAGEVSTAIGFQVQVDEINDVPGEASLAGNTWGSTTAGITKGTQSTRALFAEFKVPLLADVPFAESLDLTASGRLTDVDTYGSDETFKLGVSWQIADGYTLRMSRGTSFRSPALFELFLAEQTGFNSQRQIDVCLDYVANYEADLISERVYNNCKADVPESYTFGSLGATITTSGGEGRLNAETSVSEGIGFVWTSPNDTYAASIDYYDIEIFDEITSLTGQQIVSRCYNSLDFENEPLCDLFDRHNDPVAGEYGIKSVQSGYVNISSQVARGVDYNFTYQDDFDFGSLRFEVEHTMQIERFVKLFEDSIYNNRIGDRGNPKHVGQARLRWSKGDYAVTWTARYFDSTNNYKYYTREDNTNTFYGEDITFVDETRWVTYHTVSGSYTYEDFDFIVGVGNIFDKEPPTVSSRASTQMGNADRYSQFDIRGRRIFANVRYSF